MEPKPHDYITQQAINKNPEIEEILKVMPTLLYFFFMCCLNVIFREYQMKNSIHLPPDVAICLL